MYNVGVRGRRKTLRNPDKASQGRRAAFLIPSDRLGGAERVVRTVAACAAVSGRFEGVDIFVLCWNRSGTLDALEVQGAVELHYTEAKSELGGIWGLVKFLASRRFSLVFSSSTHLNAFASFLRRIRVLRTDRLIARESTVIFERSFGWSGVIFRSLYLFYGTQDLIICQTDLMRESLNRHTRRRFDGILKTLPNPIDYDRVSHGKVLRFRSNTARLRIAWCGRLVDIKNPEFALRIMDCLNAAGATFEFFIIGDGPKMNELKQIVKKLQLDRDLVTFLGYVENPCSVMASCDVGLVTSDMEGFPNVVLEMLASGINKVVSTDCAGGLDRIPGVVVVNSRNPQVFAKEILSDQNFADRSVIDGHLESHSAVRFLACMMADETGRIS